MRPTTTLVGLLSMASAAMAMPTLPQEPVAGLVAESDTIELTSWPSSVNIFELPFKIVDTLFKPITERKYNSPDGRRVSLLDAVLEGVARGLEERARIEREKLEAEGANENDSTEPVTEDKPATEDGAKDDPAFEAMLSVFKGLSEQIQNQRND
ncbi:hypothetical protein GQ607_008175 [Colletotrichum asianum]|uniref:Uncharacterized protein n=1 Tax=Colletotrichum asianum TaxID=702518 RepID=A0A8H3WEV4_9PEZI|nr:hypothetical protein GQ607_008175 [Colletotrichum asianum]